MKTLLSVCLTKGPMEKVGKESSCKIGLNMSSQIISTDSYVQTLYTLAHTQR